MLSSLITVHDEIRAASGEIACLCIWKTAAPGERAIYLWTIGFSRHLITKHLRPTYTCIDITAGEAAASSPPSTAILASLKTHRRNPGLDTNTLEFYHQTRGMKLKSLIFFLHARSRSISPRLGRDIFRAIGFSRLRHSGPDCLPAGGPGLTARLGGEQLLLPRRVYLRLAMRIAIIYPSPTPPKKKRNRQEGERGEDWEGQNWFFLTHTAQGTLGTPSSDHLFPEMNWINLV